MNWVYGWFICGILCWIIGCFTDRWLYNKGSVNFKEDTKLALISTCLGYVMILFLIKSILGGLKR